MIGVITYLPAVEVGLLCVKVPLATAMGPTFYLLLVVEVLTLVILGIQALLPVPEAVVTKVE
jgi:hypothetical protein